MLLQKFLRRIPMPAALAQMCGRTEENCGRASYLAYLCVALQFVQETPACRVEAEIIMR